MSFLLAPVTLSPDPGEVRIVSPSLLGYIGGMMRFEASLGDGLTWIICATCGRIARKGKSNARNCSDVCATRRRVARHRAKKKQERNHGK